MPNRLFRNSFLKVFIFVLKLAIAFVMTPMILRGLGNHDYGIYDIVLSVVGYMGMLQFGMQPAIITFVSRYENLHERKELEKVFSNK